MTKLRIPLLILAISFTHALAQDAASEESWGWGGEEFPEAHTHTAAGTTIKIPLLDEVIGRHLLDKDFKFIANADSIREYAAKSYIADQYALRLPWGVEQFEFFRDVYAYLDSDAWEEDLEKLPAGDAAFVRVIVYDEFFGRLDKRYVQIQLAKIENEEQRSYLKQLYYVKTEKEELHKSRWILGIGFGTNFYSNGSEDIFKNSPAVNMNVGYCLFGRYCADFHIGSVFLQGIKEDVVQEGHTYSGNDVTYTAVEALFRINVFTSYDYDFAVYGGLMLHALENGAMQDDKYIEKYGRKMDDIYSYGYTTGIIGTKYFGGDNASSRIFGLGARIGVATFGDTELHITGYNWYTGIDLVVRFGML